jgi:ABC-type antimicrobial peptide transport system permease subunit
VSRDVKATGLDDRLGDGLEFYYPWNTTGRGWGVYYYTVRTSLPDAQVLPVLRERFRAADPRAPILRSSDSRSYLLTSIARPRFFVVLLTLFAGIATAVAAVGIYAVFAYSVSQRRHELGVRMALGATGNQMLRLVISEGLVLAATGTVLGLGGAWMLSRTLQTLLFQVTPTDPLALGIAAACLLLLAAIACSVPALRAKRLDPLVMLKVE